jgi:hypothetical protein
MTVKPIMFIDEEKPLIKCKIENRESSTSMSALAVHEIKLNMWRPNDSCTTKHYIQNVGKTTT